MQFDDDETIGDFQPPETSDAEPPQTARSASPERGSTSLPPRYASTSLIDEGGMGHVLLAHDRAMSREVAVKRLRSMYAKREDLRLRFLREARIQARLEHPGIVPIYDVGEADDGAPFFAMKRLNGVTLHTILNRIAMGDRVESARFPLRRRIEVFENVCQTMLFAHHRGIVHRDIKPANIMVGNFGEVYVLDWGIAKQMDQTPAMQQTRTGEQMGTPGYMAPEQAIGSLEVDDRSDVYSLGVILYELLTLEPMYTGTPDDKIAATLKDQVPSPRERAPLQEIPAALEAITMRATTFDPKHRYANLQELHQDLTQWLDGERSASERSRLALQHTERATELSVADPAGAVRELSSALAIDPECAPAKDRLVEILAMPTAASKDATEALEQRATANLVQAANRTFLAYAAYLPCLAFIYLGGVHSKPLWNALLVALGLTALTGLVVRIRPSRSSVLVSTTFGFVVLGMVSTLAGPFSMASAVVVGNGAALILAARPSAPQRMLLFLASGLALSTPYLLALAGWASMPYGYVEGRLFVAPMLAQFDQVWTSAAAITATAVSLAATYYLVGRAVDSLREAERQTFLRAWRLERLLPSAAAEAGNEAPAP